VDDVVAAADIQLTDWDFIEIESVAGLAGGGE
jgi:hypothetical protein